MKRKLAWLISRVFEPVWEVPLLVWLTVDYSVQAGSRARILEYLFFIDIVLPGIFLFSLMKTDRVSDWDFTNRKEREKAYFFIVGCHFIGILMAFFLGFDLLWKMLSVLWLITFVFMLINLYWKISVHAGVNALLMIFLNSLFGWKMFAWMSMILILVLWARVKTRKHTVTQVMVGAALSMAIAELGFRFMGII